MFTCRGMYANRTSMCLRYPGSRLKAKRESLLLLGMIWWAMMIGRTIKSLSSGSYLYAVFLVQNIQEAQHLIIHTVVKDILILTNISYYFNRRSSNNSIFFFFFIILIIQLTEGLLHGDNSQVPHYSRKNCTIVYSNGHIQMSIIDK